MHKPPAEEYIKKYDLPNTIEIAYAGDDAEGKKHYFVKQKVYITLEDIKKIPISEKITAALIKDPETEKKTNGIRKKH